MKIGRIRVLAGFAMLILCISVCTNTSNAAEVWSDNFDDENLDGWTIFAYTNGTSLVTKAGNFSAAGGVMTVLDDDINVARYNSTTNVGTWSFDMYVPDDGEGSIDVMFMSNGTRPFPAYSSMTVAVEAWLDMDRFDLWELRGNLQGNLFAQYTPPGGLEGWHHFDVSRTSGGRFLLYLNGTLISDTVNNDVTSSTYLEVVCWNASGAAIDNIVVDDEPLLPPTTTPSTTPTPTAIPLPWDLIAIVSGVAVVVIVLAIVCLKRR